MTINQQFFDVYNVGSGAFMLRATLPTLSLIFRWRRAAEKRVEDSGSKPTDMHGYTQEGIRLVPVMSDWQPDGMPDQTPVDLRRSFSGTDHGFAPQDDGSYRMVPSGDIVDLAERNRRLA